MPMISPEALSDPTPPVPGPAQRAAVAGRARQLGRRRRLVQGASVLGVVALLGVATAAVLDANGSDPSISVAPADSAPVADVASVLGRATNLPQGTTLTVTLRDDEEHAYTVHGAPATAGGVSTFSFDAIPPGSYDAVYSIESETSQFVERVAVTITAGSNELRYRLE